MSGNAKEIIFEQDARQKLLEGIVKATDAIGCTLGPVGRNVGLERSWGAPVVTNDGNTIIKELSFSDQYENMGLSMVKEVASKLKEKCGDGTTTASLLLRAMVATGMKYITAGASPICLKRGMEKAAESIVTSLEKAAISIKNPQEILAIATVSASGHQEIGQVIADAIQKVGKEGVVTIQEGKSTETTIEVVNGMRFDRGYISPYFCTNTDAAIVEMQDPYLLLVEKKVSSIQEILPILQLTAASGRGLIIVAEDVEGDALAALVVNKLRGTLKVAAVKAPGFGDRKKALLEDIAILTGAKVIAEDAGLTLKQADLSVLGTAEKITITKEHTTIVSGSEIQAANQKQVKARVAQIEAEINVATSSYDKEKLQERKAKLAGGVAVISVGAPTEPEMKQRKQMFEDSLSSTKAALEEGILPGGGVALLRHSISAAEHGLSGEEALGAQIVIKACQKPAQQIIENTGFESAVWLQEILNASGHVGFNARTEKVEDLIDAGVIDAAKVVKNCLIHATSVAGVILISEALIGDAPDDDVVAS